MTDGLAEQARLAGQAMPYPGNPQRLAGCSPPVMFFSNLAKKKKGRTPVRTSPPAELDRAFAPNGLGRRCRDPISRAPNLDRTVSYLLGVVGDSSSWSSIRQNLEAFDRSNRTITGMEMASGSSK